jgi:hypothetical protein
MNFHPRTDKEINDSKLIPPGDYNFEILDAREANSRSSGNPMMELKLKVSNGNGVSRILPDYLLERNIEKLKNCCVACGIADQYQKGNVSPEDFKGKCGRVRIAVQKGKDGYFDKNTVANYLTPQLPKLPKPPGTTA